MEIQNPTPVADTTPTPISKILEEMEELDERYGTEVGKICPQCKQGVMVKMGGCTECSKQCGMKGSCDMK